MLMVVVNIVTSYKKWSQMHLRPLLKILFFLFWITALVLSILEEINKSLKTLIPPVPTEKHWNMAARNCIKFMTVNSLRKLIIIS